MADGVFDAVCPRPVRATNPSAALAHRHKARKAVAGHATDADDLRHLLDILALWPDDDDEAVRTVPLLDRRDHPYRQKGRSRK